MKEKNNQLTSGSVSQGIIRFALPLLGANIVQQLYNTVDLMFVGKLLGTDQQAAVGASSLFITCLVGLFGGISIGVGVTTSQFYGAEDENGVSRTIHTSFALSALAGIIMSLLGYWFSPWFISLINTPKHLIPSAISYLRIYFLSLISVITYNISSGIIRAAGDSRTPLLVQVAGGVMNVAMDAVFLLVFHLGVDGVAWATLISQTFAAALSVAYILRVYSVSLRSIRLDRDICTRILKIGIPSGVQSLVITLSNVYAQYHINSFGEHTIAAFTAYFKVELPIYMPIVSIGKATTTFIAQNKGARNPQRMRQGLQTCLCLGFGVTALMSVCMLAFGRTAFGLFNSDSTVIDIGMRIIQVTFPFYFLYVILEILGAYLRGLGCSTPPMLIVTLNICLLRTLMLTWIMLVWHDVRGVAMAYPITWLTTSACMYLYYRYYQKHNHTLAGV